LSLTRPPWTLYEEGKLIRPDNLVVIKARPALPAAKLAAPAAPDGACANTTQRRTLMRSWRSQRRPSDKGSLRIPTGAGATPGVSQNASQDGGKLAQRKGA
jgi:hypothetical protein